MSYLQKLLPYERVCIQCHNNPDADCIAAAFAVYSYLKSRGKDPFIVYGGNQIIKRNALLMMIRQCNIPIEYTHTPAPFDLLLMVDCQYNGGNAEPFPAENIMTIDHHPLCGKTTPDCFVDSSYQSCSTILWEFLKEEEFAIDEVLSSALLFGLYTDTALFSDLYARKDTIMKMELYSRQPLFEKLAKTNMTVAELMIASEAINNHILNIEHRFAIVEAMACEQSILGTIGDFMIQADIILLSFTYTSSDNGYRISIRSCDEVLKANAVAEFVCKDMGNGGGHHNKAGGYISRARFVEKYGNASPTDIFEELIAQYIETKDQSRPSL